MKYKFNLFRLFRFFRSERGTAIAELAVIAPIMILILGAVYELGRAYYLQANLDYGAKEAAKMGASISISGTTVSKTSIDSIVTMSIVIPGVVQESGQFTIKYYTRTGTELTGASLPFDRTGNPAGSLDLIEVTLTYPGTGAGVNTPIPAVFNPGEVFMGNIILTSRAICQVEG